MFFHKAFILKKLKQITAIGLGLLGGSITLAVLRSFSSIRTIGFAHRAVTRKKARELSIAGKIAGDIAESVKDSDLVIIATPISTFDGIFHAISPSRTLWFFLWRPPIAVCCMPFLFVPSHLFTHLVKPAV